MHKNTVVFPYTNDKYTEKEIKERMPFKVASKNV